MQKPININVMAYDPAKNLRELSVSLDARFSDDYAKDDTRVSHFINLLYADIKKLLTNYFDACKIHYPQDEPAITIS